jgi:hypothetical protein
MNMKSSRKLVTLLMVIAITISMSTPMVYAPNRRPHDHIGNLIDEDDPTLYGPATVLSVSLNKVAKLEEELGIDLEDNAKSLNLSPKDLAKLDKAIAKANDAIKKFVEKAELTNEKSTYPVRIYLNKQSLWLASIVEETGLER